MLKQWEKTERPSDAKLEERLQGSRSPDLPRRVAKPRRGR